MIEIECLICSESVETHDVMKAVAFDREHNEMHQDQQDIPPVVHAETEPTA